MKIYSCLLSSFKDRRRKSIGPKKEDIKVGFGEGEFPGSEKKGVRFRKRRSSGFGEEGVQGPKKKGFRGLKRRSAGSGEEGRPREEQGQGLEKD